MSDEENPELIKSKTGAVIRKVQGGIYGRTKYEVVEGADNEEEVVQQANEVPKVLKNLVPIRPKMEFEKLVGKVETLNPDTPVEQLGGFYCKLCDALMKDSNGWFDHVNGIKHNKMLGMNMKVERVSVDRVKDKFQQLKKKSEGHALIKSFEDFEANYAEQEKRKAEVELKEKKKKKKMKTENERIEEQLEDIEAEEAATLGLPLSFASKKKK